MDALLAQGWPALLIQSSMGIALAASAGLRAFLPLLVVGVAGRLEWIRLADSFDWLCGTPALVVFGVAVVFEVLADKIPVVDHVLDAAQTLVKPAAGAVLAAAVVTDWHPLVWTVAAVIAGGSLAGGVHLAKAKLRLASTVLSAGFANPVLSLIEDATAVAVSLAALFVPVLVAGSVLVASCAALAFLLLLNRRRRQSRARAPFGSPGTASPR